MPAHIRRMHQAFVAAGGQADLELFPPLEPDGHLLVEAVHLWQDDVDRFSLAP